MEDTVNEEAPNSVRRLAVSSPGNKKMHIARVMLVFVLS
jgi:hypothetical protein